MSAAVLHPVVLGARAVADWLAAGAVHGTAVALLTGLLMVTVLRRARPALIAALWSLVLLKFLVPIGPRATVSLSSALDRALSGAAAPATTQAGGGAAAAVATGQGAPAALGPSSILLLAIVALYLAIVAVALGRRVVRARVLRRHVGSLPAAPPALAGRVAEAAHRLGLRRPPRTRIDAAGISPYLAGALRPVLVLPAALEPDSPACAAALIHELAHIRRRDPAVRLLESAARCLLWPWPPVAWVCRQLDRAREKACDQWALQHGPLGPRAYAGYLVELAQAQARAHRRPGAGEAAAALALIRSPSQLSVRVEAILAGRRPPTLGLVLVSSLAPWAVLCLTGPAAASSATPAHAPVCQIDPALMAEILASHPDADQDGDGVLSEREACAHQLRMRRRLLDEVVDANMVSRLDPDADLDGDGVLSEREIDWFKNQIDVSLGTDRDAPVVLEYGGGPAVPVSRQRVVVAASPAPPRLCGPARCTDRSRRPAPLFIDVFPEPESSTTPE